LFTQKLIKESTDYKNKGNSYFGQGQYKNAIEEYENALMTCPESLNKERAIYFGNIAACHLKQVNICIYI
jgi:tetratricopeptide (TPR) repeat protein